jgi:hypothetical protein
MRRRDIFAAAAGAAATIVLGGSVAWAAIPDAAGLIHGCHKLNNGQLRVVESADDCHPSERAIDWNQTGQQGPPGMDGSDGTDGVSPSVTPLAAGDANCPAGGAAITDAAGSVAYVCSGQAGEDGADGEPFSGTFTSPNGEYSISVTDTGVALTHGPTAHITLAGNDVTVRGMNVDLRGDLNATLRGAIALVDGQASATIRAGGVAAVQGALVQVKGGGACLPAARLGDAVAAPGGAGTIVSGAPTVCVG